MNNAALIMGIADVTKIVILWIIYYAILIMIALITNASLMMGNVGTVLQIVLEICLVIRNATQSVILLNASMIVEIALIVII